MKKIVVLVLAVLSAACLLVGCSGNDVPFSQKSYEVDGAQIEEIKIDVRDRRIEVSASADHQIRIDYSENEQEYYDISVSEDKVLTMTLKSDKNWTDYIGTKPDAEARKISLQIPNALLSKLMLETTNEDIVLAPLTVKGDVLLSANGGNITFEKIDVGNALNLTVKNGDIRGSVIGGWDDFAIACEIKKGESNLPADKQDGAKKLQINANNGDVTVDFQ